MKEYLNELKKHGEVIIGRNERNAFFDYCTGKIDFSKYAMDLTTDGKILIYLI